jgi:hypothetical protein
MKFFNHLCFFFYASFCFLNAQETSPYSAKTYTTLEIVGTSAPSIDGSLDDLIWASVEWGSDFIEVDPQSKLNLKSSTTKSTFTSL